MPGIVLQINISRGGVPKRPIARGELGFLGLAGDDHNDTQHHGGPRKALLLIAAEVVDELRGEGWPLFYGALGENITTRGMDHKRWRPGQKYAIGSTIIELTQPRGPCATLDVYGRGIQKRIFDAQVKALDATSQRWGLSGFYAAVRRPGIIETNDSLEAIEQLA